VLSGLPVLLVSSGVWVAVLLPGSVLVLLLPLPVLVPLPLRVGVVGGSVGKGGFSSTGRSGLEEVGLSFTEVPAGAAGVGVGGIDR